MEDNLKISSKTIFLYTDGACSENPGPGGYGILLKCGEYEKQIYGSFKETTNNRMELLAVIIGLEAIIRKNATVEVFSDSKYVVNSINNAWIKKWQANEFKKIKNQDLWKRFIEVYSKHSVKFHWVKGHAGHRENEICDKLASNAYKKDLQNGIEPKTDFAYLEEKNKKEVLQSSITKT